MTQAAARIPSRALAVEAPIDDSTMREVRFALDNGCEYAKSIATRLSRRMQPFPDLSAVRLAELGTPDRFSPLLVCRAFGARVAAVHTHFVRWDAGTHAFLRALGRVGAEEYPGADWSWIDSTLEAGSYGEGVIEFIEAPCLAGPLPIEDDSFDALVTNAVLNQVDLRGLLPELYRITRPDGFGIHQVDFRDGRDYSRPLEFLTLTDEQVEQQRAAGRWSPGHRLRPAEMLRAFQGAGFRVEHFGPNMLADDDCLAAVRPRLAPRFAVMTDEELRPISGRFYLRAITDAQVREDVEYAIRVAEEYAALICGEMSRDAESVLPLSGLRVLELGPGRHFGTPLVMQGLGASVAVLDKYLAEWDVGYHPRFYRLLRDMLAQRRPHNDWSGIDRILDAAAHLPDVIAQDRTDLAEPPSGFADASFDVIVSNAVLEHVGDVPKTAAEMARLTAAGGINLHQVDFRDHRDFARPLDFLTMPDEAYRRLFDEMMNGNGNRVRPEEMGDEFRCAGFAVGRFAANIRASAEHVAEVRPRLRPQFARLSDDELSVVSGRFYLRRLALEAVSLAPAGRNKKFADTDLAEDRWAVEGAMDEHVRYAIINGVFYVSAIAHRFGRPPLAGAGDGAVSEYGILADLSGLSVLELGPGPNFGAVLIAHACGARVSVLDKYLASWDPRYHPLYYRALLRACRRHFPYADWRGLRQVIDAGEHAGPVVAAASGDLAQPPSPYADASFDAVVSNAVVEHIGDTAAMSRELARLTRAGGIGIHQVDFRDHEHQESPLDFLTVPDGEFIPRFVKSNNSQGNRVRAHELAGDLESAGFSIEMTEPNLFADEVHLKEIRPRLQPRFASMSDEQLRVVSARFYVRREESAGDDDEQPIARAFTQRRADLVDPADHVNDQVGYCLRNAIDYAYEIASHFGRLRGPRPDFEKVRVIRDLPDLTGLHVLELGPGRNFGAMLICAALGARIAVLDKYLAPWDESYHAGFYRRLRDVVRQRLPAADRSPLDAVIRAAAHPSEVIPQYAGDLGSPSSGPAGVSFDAIVSNAVLEHVGDAACASLELARLTKAGGLGLHQIDYRDHDDFARPYGFLRHGDARYRRLFLQTRNENGNRVRPHEWAVEFGRAGFEVMRHEANLFADPRQLAEARPGLAPRFARMTDEQLLTLSGRFVLRRTNRPAPRPARARNIWRRLIDRIIEGK